MIPHGILARAMLGVLPKMGLGVQKQAVCALVMRCFGDMLAEIPLIATKTNARRHGHARHLIEALSRLLTEVSHQLAKQSKSTWEGGLKTPRSHIYWLS